MGNRSIPRRAGPLNIRAVFILDGVDTGNGAALIRLMRSNEPIEKATRDAIADALERRRGTRLEFHRGNEATKIQRGVTEMRYQSIADCVDRFASEGQAAKNAKKDVAQLFGVSLRTVATALRWRASIDQELRRKRGEV